MLPARASLGWEERAPFAIGSPYALHVVRAATRPRTKPITAHPGREALVETRLADGPVRLVRRARPDTQRAQPIAHEPD